MGNHSCYKLIIQIEDDGKVSVKTDLKTIVKLEPKEMMILSDRIAHRDGSN